MHVYGCRIPRQWGCRALFVFSHLVPLLCRMKLDRARCDACGCERMLPKLPFPRTASSAVYQHSFKPHFAHFTAKASINTLLWYRIFSCSTKMRPLRFPPSFLESQEFVAVKMKRLIVAAFACVVASASAFVPLTSFSSFRLVAAPKSISLAEKKHTSLQHSGSRRALVPLELRALFGFGGGKEKVGVIGATGGVGRLAVAYLLEKGPALVRAIPDIFFEQCAQTSFTRR